MPNGTMELILTLSQAPLPSCWKRWHGLAASLPANMAHSRFSLKFDSPRARTSHLNFLIEKLLPRKKKKRRKKEWASLNFSVEKIWMPLCARGAWLAVRCCTEQARKGWKRREEREERRMVGREEGDGEKVSRESFKLRERGWFEETGWKNSFGFLRLLWRGGGNTGGNVYHHQEGDPEEEWKLNL